MTQNTTNQQSMIKNYTNRHNNLENIKRLHVILISFRNKLATLRGHTLAVFTLYQVLRVVISSR